MRKSTIWVAIAALTGLSAVLFGQALDSVLVGNVADASGAAVPNATITAINKETGVKYTTTTGSGGEYRINNVPVGRYNITAAAPGMATATKADVSMELNHTSAVNLTLQVGTVSTVAEVEEAGAIIDTSTAQLQNTFDSKTAVDVP